MIIFKQGYFIYSWNECVEENFIENDIDFGSNDKGPHAILQTADNDELNKMRKACAE